jgi:hypothetical protein
MYYTKKFRENTERDVRYTNTRTDNKVRELATVCLPWQQWTEISVLFDDVGLSAFHSYVVVDLWQYFFEWLLMLSECFGVPLRECRSLD